MKTNKKTTKKTTKELSDLGGKLLNELDKQHKENQSTEIPTTEIPTTETPKEEPIIKLETKTEYLERKNKPNKEPRIKEYGIKFIPYEQIKDSKIDLLGGEFYFSIYKNRTFSKEGKLIPKNEIRDLLQKDSRENPQNKETNDSHYNLLDSIR